MRLSMKMISAAIVVVATIQPVSADEQPAKKAVLSSANGRYVLGQISEMRRDRFLLDTQTGRVWAVSVKYLPTADGSPPTDDTPGYTVLDPVPFVNGNGDDSDAKGHFFFTPQQ